MSHPKPTFEEIKDLIDYACYRSYEAGLKNDPEPCIYDDIPELLESIRIYGNRIIVSDKQKPLFSKIEKLLDAYSEIDRAAATCRSIKNGAEIINKHLCMRRDSLLDAIRAYGCNHD